MKPNKQENAMTEKKTGLPYAKSFFDLIVYQKARDLQRHVFEVSKGFPREEAYSLTDQIRRASRSIGAQIAEAWAKRRYEKHFISKLTDADAEQRETQHWIETACDCGYVSPEISRQLLDFCQQIGRMLCTMIERAGEFCGESTATIREDSPEFFNTDS